MRKLGCLVLVVLAVVALWIFRAPIRRVVTGKPAAPAGPTWEPITSAGAARARAALQRLARPRGPVYVNVAAGDLASLVYQQLAKQLPPSADSVEAAAFGDLLHVRASVRTAELGGAGGIGPLAGFLGERERMEFGGTFNVVRPGLAEFRVEEVKLRDFSLPRAAIPRLLRRIEHGSRPAGLSDNGLPLVIPTYIGDVRVQPGKVTLYKNVQ